jgi:Bacterial regulatory helix-turn-helix protein, lysR family
MELRHLRYFVAIAEHEHIGRAARMLHVSSSPLSRQIHQLEEDIGVQLLARVGRRVRLTEAGKVFQREAAARWGDCASPSSRSAVQFQVRDWTRCRVPCASPSTKRTSASIQVPFIQPDVMTPLK